MAGLTETGFEIKRYDDIITDQRAVAQDLFGAGVDTSVNTLLGQILQLSALELATLWEELQNVYDAFNPNAAQGKSLDDLCSLVGVYRFDAQATEGFIEFTGDNGSLVPVGSQVSNPSTGDQFNTTVDTRVSTDSCYTVTYQFTSVLDSTEYSITIDGFENSYTTAVSGDTITDLRDALFTAIDGDVNLDYITVETLDADSLVITHSILGNSFESTTSASSITPISVTSLVFVRCTEVGAVFAPVNSLTQIDTSILGIDSVDNLTALTTGRDVETDDELRIRRALFATQVGKATPEAIARTVEAVQGVTEAFVIENRTMTTDIDGRPPKSYETVVVGGQSESIAEAIWESGPAGIETYGDIEEFILDENGDSHSIKFSRPDTIYISFEVDYTLYSEEAFPLGGEDSIKDAIIAYAAQNTLLGKDVIPQRYYGPIFTNVPGIATLEVRIGESTVEATPPVSFDTVNISIDSTEIADFSIDRITVTEV